MEFITLEAVMHMFIYPWKTSVGAPKVDVSSVDGGVEVLLLAHSVIQVMCFSK